MRKSLRTAVVTIAATGMLAGSMTVATAKPPAEGDCPSSFDKLTETQTVLWLSANGYPEPLDPDYPGYTPEQWAAGGFEAYNRNDDGYMCIKGDFNEGKGQPSWLYIMIDNYVGGGQTR